MKAIKRRGFLKGTLATTGILMANPFLASGSSLSLQEKDENENTFSHRLSIMCYSFHGLISSGEMDVFGFLESCKYRYNVQGVELWSGLMASYDEAYIKKVRNGLDERGLICSSLAVDEGYVWGRTDDEAEREACYKVAWENLRAGAILGAKLVRIDAGGANQATEWSNEAFDFIVKRYREYCQFAQDNGFKVGPEVHWGPETYFSNMKKLVEGVNHTSFGILEMINSFKGTPEEKRAADKEAAKWSCATHFSWNVCADDAMLEERMGFLRDAGYQILFGIEHHSAKNEYANTGIQVAKVRAVLEKWRMGIA